MDIGKLRVEFALDIALKNVVRIKKHIQELWNRQEIADAVPILLMKVEEELCHAVRLEGGHGMANRKET